MATDKNDNKEKENKKKAKPKKYPRKKTKIAIREDVIPNAKKRKK